MISRIISIFFLTFFITNNAYAKVGKGDLTFTPEILEYFLKYVRDENATSFVVSKDGKFALYGICIDYGYGCSGGPGHTGTMMKNCKKVYGQRCYIFAQTKKFAQDKDTRTKRIRWNKSDYEFLPGNRYGLIDKNGKKSYSDIIAEGCDSKFKCWGISRDISNKEIYIILTQLGFLKDNSPKKRLEANINPNENIDTKIKKLFELYKSGGLSKDEFDIAKKMLLYSEN